MAEKRPAKPKSKTTSGQKRPGVTTQSRPVGKGVPPIHTRFQKGVSGNRNGRPKGAKNLSTIIMEAARAPVTATIDGKPRKISKLTATTMQLATKAAGGDQKSIGELLDRVEEIEAREAAARPVEFPFGPEDLEVLRGIYARMKLCEPAKKGR